MRGGAGRGLGRGRGRGARGVAPRGQTDFTDRLTAAWAPHHHGRVASSGAGRAGPLARRPRRRCRRHGDTKGRARAARGRLQAPPLTAARGSGTSLTGAGAMGDAAQRLIGSTLGLRTTPRPPGGFSLAWVSFLARSLRSRPAKFDSATPMPAFHWPSFPS